MQRPTPSAVRRKTRGLAHLPNAAPFWPASEVLVYNSMMKRLEDSAVLPILPSQIIRVAIQDFFTACPALRGSPCSCFGQLLFRSSHPRIRTSEPPGTLKL